MFSIDIQLQETRERFLCHMHFKGPSQPHLCFCLHVRIWQLHFIRCLSEQSKITVKLLKIHVIKHTFRNTAYNKTITIRFTMLQGCISIIMMSSKMVEAD